MTTRIIIVGHGAQAETYYSSCSQIPGSIVHLVAGTTFSATDAESLLNGQAGDITMLVNLLPWPTMKSVTSVAAEQGIPLLLAPPPAETREAATRLFQWLKRHQVQHAVAHPMHFHPGIARMKESASTGVLGPLTQLEIVYQNAAQDNFPLCVQSSVLTDTGGWVHYHAIDLACWLLGRPRGVQSSETPPGHLCIAYPNNCTANIRIASAPEGTSNTLDVQLSGGHGTMHYSGPHTPTNGCSACLTQTLTVGNRKHTRNLPVPRYAPLTIQVGYLLQQLKHRQPIAAHNHETSLDVLGCIDTVRQTDRSHG
ncbi:MAG: hypothetical protein K9N51_14030 [Candidatus Pacebacteria bacterium]|nr:hypothetical protein [Candidatus Paceibacterota bacterium]